jgi:hypothetical protein
LLRRYRVSLIVSVVISGVFLISNANLPVWPKPAHFALVIILVFFIAASYTKRATHGILLVCLWALLSSYIRPEFFLAYLLLLSLYIVFVVLGRDKASLSRELIAFGVVALISVLLLSTLGIPAFAGEGDRNFVAFSQHFALNWVTWTGSDLDPWADYAQITSEHFGDARSMLEALQNNPALFLKHTTSNFVGGINELTILFLPNGAFSSGDLPHTTFEPYLLEGLLGLYIAYRFAYRLATGSMSGVRSNIAEHKTLLLLLSPFVLTGLASAILIYPRDHYLLIPGLFIVIAAALLAVGDPGKLEETKYRQVVCIGVLVVLLTPAIANGDATDKSYIETINFIKSLGIEEQVNLLEAEGGFNFYLADNFRSLSVDEKDTNFSEFLEEKDINMIVVTDRLEQKMKLSDAEEWQWFVDDHYRDLGYEKISIPDTTWELIIKKGILE